MRTFRTAFLVSVLAGAVAACATTSQEGEQADERAAITNADTGAQEAEVLSSTDQFQATSGDFGPREAMPGAALYQTRCAQCHTGQVPKAPHLSWLEMMTPTGILKSMNGGIMATQSAGLSKREREHIAEYITRTRVGSDAVAETPMCDDGIAGFNRTSPPGAVGWGHDTSRFVPHDVGGIDGASAADLELAWAFAFPGAMRARSQPSIGYGAVFVGSQSGLVYAFDLDRGCARWTFQATAEVRTGIVLTPGASDRPLAYFGDILAKLYAVDALTGELVWTRRADDHHSATLTGTPAIHGQRLFVPVSSLEVIAAADPDYECCTFRGSVLALDAATGKTIWRHYAIADAPSPTSTTAAGTRVLSPSGAPVWNSPAIDHRRNRLYFGTGENYSTPADGNSDAVIAVDLATGERLWQRQSTAGDAWNVACMMADNPNCPPEQGPDFDHGSSVILVDKPDGDQVLVVGHKNGTIFGLDPDAEGAVLFAQRVGRGSIQGGVHFGMAAEGHVVYAPINDMNDTRNGDVLDPDLARPGVHAINAIDGSVLWNHVQEDQCGKGREFCDPGVSAAITAAPGVVFAGHLDGVVRAYARNDGSILWEYDTTQPVDTINGVAGRGGSMSGAGSAIGDGYFVTNSGYGLYFHEPGNLLLVFKRRR